MAGSSHASRPRGRSWGMFLFHNSFQKSVSSSSLQLASSHWKTAQAADSLLNCLLLSRLHRLLKLSRAAHAATVCPISMHLQEQLYLVWWGCVWWWRSVITGCQSMFKPSLSLFQQQNSSQLASLGLMMAMLARGVHCPLIAGSYTFSEFVLIMFLKFH